MTQIQTEQINVLNKKYHDYCLNSDHWIILPPPFYSQQWIKIDLSKNNPELKNIDLKESMHPLGDYIESLKSARNSTVGYGGWQEDRTLYQASKHFAIGTNSRSIHLGVDLWMPAGTPFLCPHEATIHSFRDNANFLDMQREDGDFVGVSSRLDADFYRQLCPDPHILLKPSLAE